MMNHKKIILSSATEIPVANGTNALSCVIENTFTIRLADIWDKSQSTVKRYENVKCICWFCHFKNFFSVAVRTNLFAS